MALFRRKNNPTISEIESYYEQQNRRSNSTGRAWIMAILAIILTIAVLALLFFGGRWFYNTFIDDAAETGTSQDVNSGTVDIDGFDNDTSTSTDTDESSNGTEGTVDDQAATTDESNVDRVAGGSTRSNGSSSSSTSGNDADDSGSVAGSATNIPNTGPGETALVISLAAGLLATIASYRKKLQKSN